MNRRDAEELEAKLMEEIVRRRGLGGYNSDAPGLLLYGQVMLEIVRHIKSEMPRPKKSK